MNICAYKAPEFDYECGLKALPGEPMCFWHIPRHNMETVNIYRQHLGNEEKIADTLHGFPERQLIGFQLPGVILKETNFFKS